MKKYPYLAKQLKRNVYSAKGSFKPNQAGYAETESKQLATKIWSMAYDWNALLFPQEIPNN